MTDKIASNLDTTREIVEKILVKLYINGSIKDGQLSKKILQTMANDFIRCNNIGNFSYDEMPRAMLRYNFCYYMKPDLAHKSKCFLVNTTEIERVVEKYPKDKLLKIVDGEDQNYLNACSLEYMITAEQKQKIGLSDSNCFVYKKTFDDDKKFLTGCVNDISIDKSNCWSQLINLTTDFQPKEAKLIFKIESIQTIKIVVSRVFVIPHVVSSDKDHYVLTTYEEDSCTKFDLFYEKLSILSHPYSILIYFDIDFKSGLVTEYHFTLNKSLCCNENKLDEAIKEKKLRFLPYHIDRMFLDPLPSYDPSKEMKKLTQKKFAKNSLTDEEKFLLAKINVFSRNGLTSTNYVDFWETFIEMEDCAATEQFASIDKLGKKLISQEKYYVLQIPNVPEQSPAIMEGGEVIVVPSNEVSKKMIGRVYQVRTNDIVLDMDGDILDRNTLYNIHFLPNRVTIQLEREALNYVSMNKISKFFFPKSLPTHPIDYRGFEWINESVKTNPEQQSAIIHIVEKTSFPAPYILMGPPGTGKTTTIVEAVCQILKRDKDAKILIAASSNYACDVLALRLLKYLPEQCVYRMFGKSMEAEIHSIHPLLKRNSNLSSRHHYYPCITHLKTYNIIIATLTVTGKFAHAKVDFKHFSYVFIDESGSSTEPSTFVPIAGVISSEGKVYGQVILSGDPKQLGPVVVADRTKNRLGVSLLERLIDTGIYSRDSGTGKYNSRVITKLIRNFRSHPKILEFPNNQFYNSELIAEGDSEVTSWACDWTYLPNKSVPILFEHVIGRTMQDDNSPSLYNRREIARVLFYIEELLKDEKIFGRKITQKCIGVISPYKKQCQKIKYACMYRKWEDIDVGSVEKFQGQEKPVIIISTVRSLMRGLGFLSNPKRLNVALTRAQTLLIVVGNVNTLQIDPLWRKFIDFCDENGLIRHIGEDKKEFSKKKDVHLKNVSKNAPDVTTNDSGEITPSHRLKLDNRQISSKNTKCLNITSNQPHSEEPLKLQPRSKIDQLPRDKRCSKPSVNTLQASLSALSLNLPYVSTELSGNLRNSQRVFMIQKDHLSHRRAST
ncbi:putative helicase mov-10-B.1 isoform X1 [Phlebotomus papatasi]|uniref:putative helicase mov-10-B.1 isoform X1 n=1 Tax=Phlebotomus papatasi TaxID=29031 RepID=UPI002483CAFB|nr:putative helicase mov-10-B.1 isoform X1 [Phlebotomus papatasi]